MPAIVNEQKPLRLAARISAAMGDVGNVAKAGKNKDQGYAYQKAADIFAAAQQAFSKHGICLIADEDFIEWPEPLTTRNGATMFICRARMAYTLRDAESDEAITVRHTGLGYDTSDKALNKAKTAAEKYFLKQCLLFGEDEDDADDETLEPEAKKVVACPNCGVVGAIIRGKEEYGGGWLCFGKKGGCGAKFQTDPAEVQQEKPKAQNRRGTASKPPEATNPASATENSTAGDSEAVAGTPGGFDIEQQTLDLQMLIEQVRYPSGKKPWTLPEALMRLQTMCNVDDLRQISDKHRQSLMAALARRQKMIDAGTKFPEFES